MTTQPRRRWFRFGRRTLFVVVTIVGVWLGWLVGQIEIVRERKAIVAEFRGARRFVAGSLEAWEAERPPLEREYEYARVSRVRRFLGDESYTCLDFPADAHAKVLERAEHAFPESELFVDYHWSGRLIAYRDSLHKPMTERSKNIGTVFKTGLINK